MAEYNIPEEWIERIRDGEGLSSYVNTNDGHPTIGYGHKCETPQEEAQIKAQYGYPISAANADKLLRKDLQRFCKQVDEAFPWWKNADENTRYVVLDMCYNQGLGKGNDGHGLKSFKKMLAAMEAGDHQKASEEIVHSGYYRQVPRRAARNAELMRTGQFHYFEPKMSSDGRVLRHPDGRVRVTENGVEYNYNTASTQRQRGGTEQRSSAPEQRSSVGRTDTPTQRSSEGQRRAAPTKQSVNLEHEQQWIKQIAAGQKFRDTAATVATKSGEKTVIGYNHKIKDSEKKLRNRKITPQEAEGLLRNDLRASGVYERLNANFPWWKDLDPKAQGIMVDMCYNKEIGYTDRAALHVFFEAMQKGDYAAAAKELDSIEYPVTYPDDVQRNVRLKQNAAILRELGNQPTQEQTHVDNQEVARQTPAQPARTTQTARPAQPVSRDKTATKQQLRDDSLKAQKILDNFNSQHKRKFENTHTTREGIEAAFAGKDIEASKIITKALMNPTVVAQRLGLTDEHGKPLKSSRAVVEALSKLDSQKDQEKIDQMVQLAHELKSRRSR